MMPRAAADPTAAAMTLAELAAKIGGRAEGDGGLRLTGVAGLAEAGPAEVTFVDGRSRLALAAAGSAGAVILAEALALPGRNLIRVANPRLAYARALELFHPPARPAAGVHPSAIVDPAADVDATASIGALCHVAGGARIGPRCVLHPCCHVGEHAVLGEDVLLHPRVTVCDHVRIGDRVIVQSGAVLGSDGFGYVFDGRRHCRVPQVGTVEIGDDAEIGANTTVDRATTGVTRIGRGTKIDNLVQIGHNVRIGEHCIIVSQVGIAGSTTVGDGVLIGGQTGIAPGSVIGDRAMIAAGSGIMKKVEAGAVVAGLGPLPHGDWLRSQAVYDKLPQLRRQLNDLEKRLAAAEGAPGLANAEKEQEVL